MKTSICEICGKEKDFIKEHHIQSKCYGGEDKPYNIAKICNSCHDYVHYGLIIIEGRFTSIEGNVLVWRKLNESSITEMKDPKVFLKPNHKKMQELYLKRITS